MSSINVLFFSNSCDMSTNLLASLQMEKLTQYFHLICTDNNPNVPPQIKTPTLIIRGVPTPYVGGDAFVWLAKVKQWKINMTLKRMNLAQQQYFQNISNNLSNNDSMNQPNNIIEFSETEMNSISDMFSFFSTNISKESQDALPQSFFACNGLGQEYICTPPLEDGSYKISDKSKYKIDKYKQKELTNKISSERLNQDKAFKQNMDNFLNTYKK